MQPEVRQAPWPPNTVFRAILNKVRHRKSGHRHKGVIRTALAKDTTSRKQNRTSNSNGWMERGLDLMLHASRNWSSAQETLRAAHQQS